MPGVAFASLKTFRRRLRLSTTIFAFGALGAIFASSAAFAQYGVARGDAIGASSIAIGDNVQGAYYPQAVQPYMTAITPYTIPTGFSNVAAGFGTIAIGEDAYAAAGNQNIALGMGAYAGQVGQNYNQSVAIGSVAWATGDQSTAIGNNTIAWGNSAVAIGGDDLDRVAAANGALYTTLTGGTITSGVYIPTNAADGSVAIGVEATGQKAFTTAIGLKATASAAGAFSIGTASLASAQGAGAIGLAAVASGTNGVAIGTNTTASQAYATALGSGGVSAPTATRATGVGATAIGGNATSGASAAGLNSVAIGGQSSVTAAGASGIAIGTGATVSAAQGIAIGVGNVVSGANSGAFGDPNFISGSGSYVVGNNNGAPTAPISTSNTFILGSNVTTTIGSDVILGNRSASYASGAFTSGTAAYPSTTVGGLTYVYAGGAAPGNVVSVGSSASQGRIQNVAAGLVSATSTDAINGSQLFAVETVASQNANAIASAAAALGGGAAYNVTTGVWTAPAYTINGAIYANVGAGLAAASTEVVAGTNIASVTKTAGADGHAVYTVNAKGVTATAGSGFVSVTPTAGANNVIDYAVDVSQDVKDAAIAVATKGVGFAGDTGTAFTRKLGETANVVGGATGALTAGNIGVVANGADTLTIQLAQNLDLGAAGSVAMGATSIGSNGLTIAGGPSVTTSGVDAGGAAVSNVGPGVVGTDAVNLNQLNSVSAVANAGWNISTNGGATTNVGPGGTVDVSIGPNAGSNLTVTNTGTNVVIDMTKTPSFTSVTTGGTTMNGSGVTIAGGPSMTTAGIDAGSTAITNVAPGVAGTDAANINQLNAGLAAAATEVVAGTNVASVMKTTGVAGQAIYTVNANGATTTAGSASVVVTPTATTGNITNYAVDVSQSVKDAVTAVGTKGVGFAGDTGMSFTRKLGETANVVGGATSALTAGNIGVVANGADTLVIQLARNLDLGAAGSVTMGTTSIGGSGLTIAGGPSVTTSGVNAGGMAISNVGPGVAGTDAVNVNQMNAVAAVANKGWNISTNGGATTNVAPGGTVDVSVGLDAGSNLTVSNTGTNVVIDMTKTPVFDGVSVAGSTVTLGPTGLNNGGNTLQGVAAGANPTDAVNLAQMTAGLAAATTEVVAGTNIFNVDKTTGAAGQPIYTVNARGATASAGSSFVTITPATGAANVTDFIVDVGQAVKDSVATVATKGVGFAGDSGTSFTRKLGETANVVGGATGALTAGNIGVVANGTDTLMIHLAQNLDLGAAGSVTMGSTSIGSNGLAIAGGPSITTNGVDAGGMTMTNVAPGIAGTDAVNVNQMNAVAAVANKGWNISTNGGAIANVTPGGTVDVSVGPNAGSNITVSNTGTNLVLDMSKTPVFDGVAIAGSTVALGPAGLNNGGQTLQGVAAGVNPTDAVNLGQMTTGLAAATTEVIAGTNVASVTKTTGVAGQPIYTVNANGVTASAGSGFVSVTPTAGANNVTDYAVDVSQSVKDAATAVATKGVGFAGDSGTSFTRKLGETTNIVGGAAGALTTGNIGVVANGADTLTIELARNLDLGAAGSVTIGATTVSNAGVLVAGGPNGPVALTSSGLDNGGNVVKNVAAGVAATDAANVGQINAVNAIATAGWNVTTAQTGSGVATGTSVQNIAPGATAMITAADNIVVTQKGAEIQIATSTTPTFASATVTNGGALTAGSTGVVNGGQINTLAGSIASSIGSTTYDPATNAFTTALTLPSSGATAYPSVQSALNALSGAGIDFTDAGATTILHKDLGMTLPIIGATSQVATALSSATPTAGLYTSRNLQTFADAAGGRIQLQFADDPVFQSVTTGQTTMTSSGLTIGAAGPAQVALTSSGLNNGGQVVSNVAPGVAGTDAANVDQINAVAAVANKGWNLSANGGAAANVAPGGTVDVSTGPNAGANLTVTSSGSNLIVDFTKTPVFDSVTIAGSTVTLGPTGLNNGGNTLQGVAAGVNPTDAVNLAQMATGLAAATTDVAAGTNIASVTKATGAAGQPVYTVNAYGAATTSGSAYVDVTTGAPGADNVTTYTVDVAQSVKDAAVAVPKGINFGGTTGSNNYQLGDMIAVRGDANILSTTVAGGAQLELAPVVTIGSSAPIRIDGSAGTVAGLTNQTWTGAAMDPSRAATEGQLASVSAVANAGWNVSTNGGPTANVAPGGTVDVSTGPNAGSNLTVSNTGTSLVVDFTKTPVFDGVSIAGSTVALGPTGLNNGGNVVANVAPGVAGTDAANVDQVTAVAAVANRGWNIAGGVVAGSSGTATGAAPFNIAPGQTATFGAGNNIALTQANGEIQIATSMTPGFTSATVVNGGALTAGSTGVVNGGQINMLAGSIASGLGGVSSFNPETGVVTTALIVPGTGATVGSVQDALTQTTAAIAARGLDFTANDAAAGVVHRDLGQTLAITGEATATGPWSGANLKTVTDPATGAIRLQMTEAPSFASVTTGGTVMNGSGLVIAGGPSMTMSGVDAGGRTIVNVAAGVAATDAVNMTQLGAVSAIAGRGWDLQTNGGPATTIAPGMAVNFVQGPSGNLRVWNDGATVGFDISTTPTFASVTTGGTTMDGSGVTIAGGPSMTVAGIDAGGRTIANVAAGAVGAGSTEAVNGGQLYAVQQTASAGWNLSVNGGAATKVAPGATVDVANTDGNIVMSRNGTNLVANLNPNLAVTSVTTAAG